MKRFTLILCLVLVALPLSVFATGEQDTNTDGVTTLTVWGRDLPDGDADHAYITYLVENFEAANPGIKLDYVALGDPGVSDKVKISMASNSGPDIFQSWGGSVMGGYADADRLLNLTAELSSVPGSAAAKKAMSWKGEIYGVAPFFAIAGLFVNEGIFADLGLTVPETVTEMEAVCDALLAKGIQPFACGAKDKWPPLATYMYLTNRYGGDIFLDAQARKTGFNNEAFVKAAAKMQEWVEKGYFGNAPLGEGYSDAQTLIGTGKAAMQITGSWMCAQFSSAEFTDQKIGFYAFPTVSGGIGSATDIMGMTDIGFTASKHASAKKEAIVAFMKYAMSVEVCSAEPGRICSVPGVEAPSLLTEKAVDVFGKATSVQFWWDQDLPPTVTSPLNDTIQTFFLLNTDVAESLNEFEKLVIENVGPVK